MNIFTKLKNAKYVQKFFITLAISLLIIIAGVVMTCVKGMNLGIEFTGGIKVSVEANDVTDKKEFENTLRKWLEGDRGVGETGESKNPDNKKFEIKNVTVNGDNYVVVLGTTMTESSKKDNMLTTKAKFKYGEKEITGYVAQRESQEIKTVRLLQAVPKNSFVNFTMKDIRNI